MDDLRNSSLNLEIVKLFVGQIPKDMDEDSLRVYFEEFGPLAELSIIRDSVNLGSKGCAFVTYRHAESAQCAVEKLHDKVKLPNSLNALQVRVAETQNERENKLFIGMLPKTVNEQDLHSMFVPYGELREVHIIRGPEGSPKGCAFVKYVDRDAAIAAIEDLNDSIPMGATRPLVVKFADSKKQGGKSKSDYGYDHHDNGGSYHMPMKSHQGGGDYWGGGSGPGHHQQSQQQQKMMYPFQQQAMMAGPYSQYGAQPHSQSQQQRYNMYVPNVGPSSNFYQQSGGPAPAPYLVASPDYQQDLGGDRKFGKPQASFPHGDRDGTGNSTAYPPAVKPAAAPYSVVPPGQFDEGGDLQPQDGAADHEPHSRPPEGPSGANLFIYHLPRDLTDADLATLFAPFGNVISAKVFVDKKTSDSKGFGFVSYDVLDSANSAIDSMNGFQIGSKRLKVQHKRVMSGGGGMDDDSFGYSGGAGNDGRDSRGGGGYGQQGSRRGGGGGGMNSLIGGMGAMNMGGYAPHDVGGGGGGGMDLYPQQGMRGGGGYNFPDYNKPQLQQQGIPIYRDGPGALQVDYQQQQLPAQQRYQQY